MVIESGGKVIKTPSSYSADIEDLDNNSYTSKITGTLIDSVVAQGMLKLSMSWDDCTEAEAEELMQLTYQNPLIATVKVPCVQGGILRNAKFRVSKRKVDMIQTEQSNTTTSGTYYKVSFNMMQKELAEQQK